MPQLGDQPPRILVVEDNGQSQQLLKELLTEDYKDPRDCLRYGVLYPVLFHDGADNGYIPLHELTTPDEYYV